MNDTDDADAVITAAITAIINENSPVSAEDQVLVDKFDRAIADGRRRVENSVIWKKALRPLKDKASKILDQMSAREWIELEALEEATRASGLPDLTSKSLWPLYHQLVANGLVTWIEHPVMGPDWANVDVLSLGHAVLATGRYELEEIDEW